MIALSSHDFDIRFLVSDAVISYRDKHEQAGGEREKLVEDRVEKAQDFIRREINKLKVWLKTIGTADEHGKMVVEYGKLFKEQNNMEALSGTLKTARRLVRSLYTHNKKSTNHQGTVGSHFLIRKTQKGYSRCTPIKWCFVNHEKRHNKGYGYCSHLYLSDAVSGGLLVAELSNRA